MLQVSDLTRVGDVLWVSGVLQVSYMPRLSNVSYASDAAGRIYMTCMQQCVRSLRLTSRGHHAQTYLGRCSGRRTDAAARCANVAADQRTVNTKDFYTLQETCSN